MEKNEIVSYGENGEILDCKFNRIDFDNPSTILSYGGDVKDEISAILDSTAQLSISNNDIKLNDSKIAAISSFDSSLDESEEKRKKSENSFIKKILKKFKIKVSEEYTQNDTYKARYKEYCDILDDICNAVETQKQESLNDIELRKSIIKEMLPLIEKLDKIIEIGHLDKKSFDEITELKKSQNEDLTTIDEQNEIKYRTQLSEILNAKLKELEAASVLYKEQVQSYRLQQKTEMELVMSADSYLKDSAPILKAQGSVMVFNRQQEQKINVLQALNKEVNQAVVKNAQTLEQNAQAITDLSLNNGISVESLKALDTSIRNGVNIFKNARDEKQKRINSDRQTLNQLKNSLNEYQAELTELIGDSNNYNNSLQTDGPVKKLGTKGVN